MHKIRVCPTRDTEVIEALQTVRLLGPAGLHCDLVDWNIKQGLLLYCGKVYVLKDIALCTDIVKTHHNLPPAGHPGQAKMLELVSRNYWWPNMGKSIKDYVDTCETCHWSKPAQGKPHDQLKPNEIPDGPGQIVTCGYIVGLPLIDRYDSIRIMVGNSHIWCHAMKRSMQRVWCTYSSMSSFDYTDCHARSSPTVVPNLQLTCSEKSSHMATNRNFMFQ